MGEKKLKAVLDAIQPDAELVERTKARMELAARSRRRKRLPNYLGLVAAACLVVVVGSGLLVNHLSGPRVYAGYFTATDDFVLTEQRKELLIGEDDLYRPVLEEDGLQPFRDLARTQSGPDSRLLVIRGEVVALSTYMAQDKEETGVLGFTMAQVKVSEISYSENAGRRARTGDTITVASYIEPANHSQLTLWVGGKFLFSLYTGSDYAPGDTVGNRIGLRQTWLSYQVLPDN